MKIIKTLLILIALNINTSFLNAQDVSVELVNQIIDTLIGAENYTDIPKFENIEDVCFSHYFTCDAYNKIKGLNFQFSNLAGKIPSEISKLKDLEYIDLEFNYLKGDIPEDIFKSRKIKKILLGGNFLSGPIPNNIYSSVHLDLKQNSIKEKNKKLIKKYNIVNQINLDNCRSPDSIFIKTNQDFVILDAVTPEKDSVDAIKVVEKMPLFPGCKDDMTYEKRKECATNLLLQFIYGNLTYPLKDHELNLEGMAIVRFVVLKDGQIVDAEVVQNPGICLGNATLWIVNRMNYLCDRWTPGFQDNNPVKVLFTLPVKFKLE